MWDSSIWNTGCQDSFYFKIYFTAESFYQNIISSFLSKQKSVLPFKQWPALLFSWKNCRYLNNNSRHERICIASSVCTWSTDVFETGENRRANKNKRLAQDVAGGKMAISFLSFVISLMNIKNRKYVNIQNRTKRCLFKTIFILF